MNLLILFSNYSSQYVKSCVNIGEKTLAQAMLSIDCFGAKKLYTQERGHIQVLSQTVKTK